MFPEELSHASLLPPGPRLCRPPRLDASVSSMPPPGAGGAGPCLTQPLSPSGRGGAREPGHKHDQSREHMRAAEGA